MTSTSQIDILLVEDDPSDAELTMRALASRHVHNPVHWVEDGAEALDFVFGRGAHAAREVAPRPRVVLLDLKLPKVDGLEVLRALKSDWRTRAIPVVVLTSSREDADIAEAYARGANSYVVKPVGYDAFVETIGRLGGYWLSVNEPSAY